MLVGKARLKIRRSSVVRAGYSCGLAVFLLFFGSRALQNAIAEGDTRTISLHHIHTDEDITITFKRDGRYDEAALEKLNWFLRDWRRQESTRMDPHLIDLVWEVQRETGSKSPIWVVCGYRSPQTNAMLRRRSRGVAKFSQHMLGHAMDFYIPGVPLEELRVIGLRLQRGGVGFYPTSGSPFVHMDTGHIRHWPRMTREQLVRVFPDGHTVHIPTDGRPLPGYALALADIKKRGDSPSEMSIDAARRAGIDVADASGGEHRNVFAKLFGFGKPNDDEENDADAAAATEASAPPAPAAPAVPLRMRAKTAVVAAITKAEDKLATEKTKLAKVVSKVHVISRAEAAPLAALSPNDVIRTRGFWQGAPDGIGAARPTTTAAEAVAAVARPRGGERANVAVQGGAQQDRVPVELALAYAEQAGHEAPPSALGTPALRAAAFRSLATLGDQDDMTVAVKRVNGRPASAVFTVASTTSVTTDATMQVNNPWLRAVVESPSVRRFLTITAMSASDFRSLAPLMIKPDNAVMMTFCADPQLGLAEDHFSGSAITFIPTVSYPTHTAALQ